MPMDAKDTQEPACDTPVDEWIEGQPFENTADVKVPKLISDQVIGQEDAVYVIRKAAEQKRHVVLIGEPGTGKSMLARAMTDFLPKGELQDVIAYPNPEDPNEPKIKIVPAGKGKEIVGAQKAEANARKDQKAQMMLTIVFLVIGFAVLMFVMDGMKNPMWILFGILGAVFIYMFARMPGARNTDMNQVPKLLITHTLDESAPFIDATGAHAGALLGDVKHDPFQSGGLETPAHERVEIGAIHKANKGILFIDEINMLRMESQQALLTALQEKKFSVVGQSERSSGAMVKSEPVPCDFVLVAAGNLDSIYGRRDDGHQHGGMHPALRSRIRGYGYEIYMKTTMADTHENRQKMIRFVAQEVVKDTKIPHFTRTAVGEIIRESQRRAGRRGQLTLRLRELGGLIRIAGDIAKENGAPMTSAEHVVMAKRIARPLEQQIADRVIERSKDYSTFINVGSAIGMVNGLAVIGADTGMSEYSGIVLPIVAEVTPAQRKNGGVIIATGRLGEIAKEAVQNVSALVKKYTGEDVSNHDIHIQFVGSGEGIEGDSASISVATAVVSAIEGIEVDQTIAMTGSLSVRGRVLPVGAVTAKIEAAAQAGIKRVLIPKSNMQDVFLEDRWSAKVEVVPVDTLAEVLKYALMGKKKDGFLDKFAAYLPQKVITERPAAH
ncbi:MAG: ATP-dependent protease LonB [Methanobacteriota archaeon]